VVPEQLTKQFDHANKKTMIISAKTSLVGVLGNPINHSLSPTIHNAALQEMNLNWCYLAIPCTSENLETALKGLKVINCKGLNITIPHKIKALKYCTEISSIAQEVNAVNTLIPNKANGWTGDNTDVKGFLAPLISAKKYKYKNVLLMGCGGSAKAVIAGLIQLNVESIVVINRSKESLYTFLTDIDQNYIQNNCLSSRPKINGISLTDEDISEYIKNSDLIINATPIGMMSKDFDQKVPIDEKIWSNLKSGTTLYDLVYNPRPTKWLKIGVKKDCKVIDGLDMLIAQGAESLSLWSGIKDIPIKKMREAAELHFANIR